METIANLVVDGVMCAGIVSLIMLPILGLWKLVEHWDNKTGKFSKFVDYMLSED